MSIPGAHGPVLHDDELDLAALGHYLDGLGHSGERPTVQRFANGLANQNYLVRREDRRWVLRRAPVAGARHTDPMAREFTALSALAPHFDRAPRAVAYCDDTTILGSPFLLSEFRDGIVVTSSIPASLRVSESVGAQLGDAVVDAFADLHSLDIDDAGLTHLGRPAGFAQRQVTGWARRWQAVDLGDAPAMSAVAGRLLRTVPEAQRAAVVHNDPKLDNCAFTAADPSRVSTIFDWDMVALGDPLMDVGALLSYWPDPSDTPGDGSNAPPGTEGLGLPSRREVADRYAGRTGLDLGGIGWYEAFASYRIAVMRQQLFVRHLRGDSSDPRHAQLGRKVGPAAERAGRLLDELDRPRSD